MISIFCRLPQFPLRWKTIWLMLSMAALPLAVQAQFTYTTNNGAITITQYTGPGGAVVIPDAINGLKVTSVGPQAFFQANMMTSLTFGTNVTTIMQNAVFQCPALTTVVVPQSVTNIADGPFIDCKALTTISLTGTNTFYVVTNGVLFTKSLKSLIEFPGGVGGSYSISGIVTNTGEAFVGNSLSAINVDAANAIYASTNGVLCDKQLKQLVSYPGTASGGYTVPGTVVSVVSAAFEYATGVTSVTMGSAVTNIGYAAFYDCSALTSIDVNSTNTYYSTTNSVLFDKAKSVLIQYPSGLPGTYVVPNTVSNIIDGAFGDAAGLTSAVISDNVTNISFETFYSCINLSSVVLGAKVATIQQAAFFFCPALKSIIFPASLKSLGFEAFGGCQNLTNACFEGNQPTDGGSVFYFDTSLTQILYVNGATGWSATYDGIATAPCPTCGGVPPTLTIAKSGTNVLVTWPSTFPGYTLQVTTNMVPPLWSTVSPTPVVVGSFYTATNPASGARKFYRLTK
jgi:BspA type Leucine rich repeat region (6 copies)